jgi:integrative and conjugative element protein (TIGR02256 family)
MISRGSRKKNSCSLLIGRSVLEFLEGEAAKATNTETGGILAGRGGLLEDNAQVVRASGPGPKARRTMLRFSRDTAYCQDLLDAWAVESGGEVDYLGEWHKHHETLPRPSARDIQTCREIAVDPKYHVDCCLLLIIGKSNNRTSLRAFIVYAALESEEIKWEEAGSDREGQ